jgi:hypothetical protein
MVFKMASFLETAIEEKNIRKIRSAIGTYIMADPTDRKNEIANGLSKIDQRGLDIWEEHDGRELEADQAKWNKDYFTELQSQLETNFSKKRFNRTLQVGRYVYRDELSRPVGVKPRGRNDQPVRQESRRDISGKYIIAGMVVVAAVAAIYFVMKNQ